MKPFTVTDIRKFYNGTIWNSKYGCKIQVLDYKDKFHVVIKFLDEYGYVTEANIDNIKAGNVKNPYRRLNNGGFYGVGEFRSVDFPKIYKTWDSMLVRSKEDYIYHSYQYTTVCQEWLNFQVFAKWYIDYMSGLSENFIYQIDKDIFQWNQKYKVYSPDTCCMIPDRLNSLLVGLHVSTKNSNLPVGVRPNLNKYSSYVTYPDGCRKYLGIFDTPEEAFELYKIEKKSIIVNAGKYFLENNGIKKDVYDKLLEIEIEPF